MPGQHDPLPASERALTIAVGFRCEDGIVIASDTQYTRGAYKGHGPKVFPLFKQQNFFGPERPDLSVVIAGAGRVAFMRRAVDKIETALSGVADPTLRGVQLVVEEELLDFFETYIYPKPDYDSDKTWFDLIVGIWTRVDGFGLFKTEDVVLTPVGDRCTIGMGFSVAEYALGLTHNATLSVDNTILPASLCVKAAKDYVDYCGGRTQMWTLRDTPPRRVQYVPQAEVEEAETHSDAMFAAVRDLIAFLGDASDEEFAGILKDAVGDSVLQFRQKQRERKERAQKIREEALRKKQAR